jgi:flagellar protein FliL
MIRKLIPLVIILLGLVGGTGAGLFLRPEPVVDEAAEKAEKAEPEVPPEYVKLSNQFIIPVVEGGEIAAMIVLSLSLEVVAGSTDAVFASEPKLRDTLLQVLFEHANSGGFRGSFTDGANLVLLRKALKEAAVQALPDQVLDVLITEIVRQDS